MKKKIGLSVALATYNEEKNIADCINSVKSIADEVVVVDGSSQDKTVEIAKKLGAKVIIRENPPIFHINKQKALETCRGEWILQLDADERVTPSLAAEIKEVILMSQAKIEKHQAALPHQELFEKHRRLLVARDGQIGTDKGPYAGFFVARLNDFWGKYLRFGGVYPDGVIRLVKKGKAYFPCRSVHEQIVVKGRVGWLKEDLVHLSNPNREIYFLRNNQYINLMVEDFKKENLEKNLVNFIAYMLIRPLNWFLSTQVIHRGILDGFHGILFSFFSALRFPKAYWRYLKS